MLTLPEKGVYLSSYHAGGLQQIADKIKKNLKECRLCPRACCVNRETTTGACQQTNMARLTNAVVHTGEEPPLITGSGAGAVFFSGCSMKCLYCQNFAFSQKNNGKYYSVEALGDLFLSLQEKGCSNLDLVTPSPHLISIVEALIYAIEKGLTIPVVYNTSGYECVEILRLMEGIVDVYLADIRYTDDEVGLKYSGVPDYWTCTQRAIREMYRQKGSAGLIVRHLVLPNELSGTQGAMAFIAEELSPSVSISLMSQYFPVHLAGEYETINRKITREEYAKAISIMDKYGLFNGWTQALD